MIRGLTTAASGLLADERLQQVLTNNLANMQTPGFKATDGEFLSFPEQLITRMNYNAPSGSSGDEVGKMGTGVTMQEGALMFTEGALQAANSGLDVAILDGTAPGTYAQVLTGGNGTGNGARTNSTTARGQVTVGANGRLEMGGRPLAVLDSQGNPVAGVYVQLNPKYQGKALYATDGSPNYDNNGQPSYRFVNARGTVLGEPGEDGWTTSAVRIGSNADMGNHSFFAVAYQSPYASGMALTRDGQFSLNANHEVVDASGNAVLPVDAAGRPIANGRIQVNTRYTGTDLFQANGSPVVDKNGQPSYRVVSTTGAPIAGARMGIVDADVTKLSLLGQTEYEVGGTLNTAQVLAALRPATGQMKPGEIEESTVDTTATMAQMTAILSLYQANANVLQTESTTLNQAVSDVGKVGS